jgi:hypothetical protein
VGVVAGLLGAETTESYLLPIYDLFLQDIDQVRQFCVYQSQQFFLFILVYEGERKYDLLMLRYFVGVMTGSISCGSKSCRTFVRGWP